MSDRRIKDAISTFLRDHGFQVTQIAEGGQRTPDLLATCGQRYLIEIKTKEDDPAANAERAKRLGAGEIVQSGAPFTPQNTMSRIVRDGVSQLEAHPVKERDFCLLWLLAIGSDLDAQYEQFLATLYGLSNVVGPDSQPLMPCYYLRDSAFFRWRDLLDGAIVGTHWRAMYQQLLTAGRFAQGILTCAGVWDGSDRPSAARSGRPGIHRRLRHRPSRRERCPAIRPDQVRSPASDDDEPWNRYRASIREHQRQGRHQTRRLSCRRHSVMRTMEMS